MKRVKKIEKYAYLFESYTHSIPVIYAALEGQYPCELYVDDIDKPKVAVLFTQFDYHFIAGAIENLTIEAKIKALIFQEYLKKKGSKEAIFIAPDESWDSIMKRIFNDYSDIVDKRYFYQLNEEKFDHIYNTKYSNNFDDVLIEEEAKFNSTFPYSVAKITKGKEIISYAAGFMIGSGHVELDVKTNEKYRQMGHGHLTSAYLIRHLIEQNLEPNWCCWQHNKASQHLAESLGFKKVKEVTTYIWVEEVNGKL